MERSFEDWKAGFARRLRAERQATERTQADLAADTKYTQQMISRYESGRVPKALWFVARLLHDTDVDVRYVLTGRIE